MSRKLKCLLSLAEGAWVVKLHINFHQLNHSISSSVKNRWILLDIKPCQHFLKHVTPCCMMVHELLHHFTSTKSRLSTTCQL